MHDPLPVVTVAVLCNDDVIKTLAIFLRMKRQYWVGTKSEIRVHIFLSTLFYERNEMKEILVKLKRHQNPKRVLKPRIIYLQFLLLAMFKGGIVLDTVVIE